MALNAPILVMMLMSGAVSTDTGDGGMVDLHDIARQNALPEPEISESITTLQKDRLTMRFYHDSRKLMCGGMLIWMNAPALKQGGACRVSKIDADTLITPILNPAQTLSGRTTRLVIIDPGHGGKDRGAVSKHRLAEKNLVLDIAKNIRKRMIANKDIEILLTRDTDEYMALEQRTECARRAKGDIFVSIHLNFAENTRATGIETYVTTPQGVSSTSLSEPDDESYEGNKSDRANIILAYLVHRETIRHTGASDRGIKHARFNVVRNAPCPSILIECGFLSNTAEEKKLAQSVYRDRIAEGIARGILEYIRLCSD